MYLTLSANLDHLTFFTHFSVCLGFVRFLNSPFFPKAFAAAEGTAFIDNKGNSQHNDQEEANHVQRMVLVPGEEVGRGAQMWGPLVPHHELHPEYSQVQWLNGAVLVEAGEAHDVFLIAKHKDSYVNTWNIEASELTFIYVCMLLPVRSAIWFFQTW